MNEGIAIMHFTVKDMSFSHHLAAELMLLTGKSYLMLQTLAYDEMKGEVCFILHRRELLSVRRKCLGIIENPVYSNACQKQTCVRIGSVVSFRSSNKSPHKTHSIQLMNGLLVKSTEVSASSVEEEKGVPFFEMTICVSHLDIEMSDVIENPVRQT